MMTSGVSDEGMVLEGERLIKVENGYEVLWACIAKTVLDSGLMI